MLTFNIDFETPHHGYMSIAEAQALVRAHMPHAISVVITSYQVAVQTFSGEPVTLRWTAQVRVTNVPKA
jgi:hypothetical protein